MDIRIKDLFSGVGDPRVEKTKKHPLENVLYIVLCGTVSGVDGPGIKTMLKNTLI